MTVNRSGCSVGYPHYNTGRLARKVGMQYAISVAPAGEIDVHALVDLAERAEALGWDGFFIEDYITFRQLQRQAQPGGWNSSNRPRWLIRKRR